MSVYSRWLGSAATLVLLLGTPHGSIAQIEPFNFKFNSGQSIQPIFEGWSRNPDGSFAMNFGYLNRNYVEEPSVPVGPDNNIEPGGPDRGQPTFFYARTNRNAFSVAVPKDWAKKELVWTLTVRGKTEKAVGWLQPEWEVERPGDRRSAGNDQPRNQPPTISVDPVPPITLPNTATFTAVVTDDGLPKPGRGRGKPAVGQETPPTLKAPDNEATAPVNVPQVGGGGQRGAGVAGGGRGGPQGPQGPTVSWIVWRGPARVTFDPSPSPVKDGKAVVTATFAKPGAYVLRALATDGQLTTPQDLKVTVNASPSSRQP
jgi:hypothetical protein